MEHLFVSFAIAKSLREKGFKESCFTWFWDNKYLPQDGQLRESSEVLYDEHNNSNATNAPTYQQVVDWFREKHEIEISSPTVKQKDKGTFYGGYLKRISDDFGKSYGSNFTSYYEAFDNSINEALKLI